MEDADKIKKTIGRPEVKEIIDFVKENPGTTTQKVVDKLKEEGIASRLTTLSMVDKLTDLGIIKDDRIGEYSHMLRYNEKYNWENLAMTILTDSTDDLKNAIYRLSFDDRVKKLMDEIQKSIDKLRLQNRELEKLVKQEEELPKQALEQPILASGVKPSLKAEYDRTYILTEKAKRTKHKRKRKNV
jgi:hypothetical protein